MKETKNYNKDVFTLEQKRDLEELGKDERIIITRKADKSNEFFLSKLDRLPQNTVLASLDIGSLFTNVPVSQTIDIMLDNV